MANKIVLPITIDDTDAQKQLKRLEKQETVVHVSTKVEGQAEKKLKETKKVIEDTQAAASKPIKVTEPVVNTGRQVKKSAAETVQAAEEAAQEVVSTVSETQRKIQAILDDTESNAASKAAKISWVYRKEGMEASEAMTKAWEAVNGGASKSSNIFQKFGKTGQKSGEQTAKGLKTAEKATVSLKSAVKGLTATFGSVFAIRQVLNFGKSCVMASTDATNALKGLQSIIDGQGRSFSQAQAFIQEYISDGLIPMNNAVTAYKNLASRGYDDTQIRSVLTSLKDSAAYGRQASYSLGEAVTSATEGLKNENSILVDNAGVTKNVAKMWEEYAKSIGTTSANLTQQQKIQAEVNGILTETRFQTGDAAKIASSFSGQVSRLNANVTALKAAIGNILTGALAPYIGYANTAVKATTNFVEAVGRLLGITGIDTTVGAQAAVAATNVDSLTKSLNGASTAAEQLTAASFDDFNVIGSETGNGSSAASIAAPDTSAVIASAENTAESVQNIFDEMLAQYDFTKLKESVSELKESFAPLKEKAGEGAKWFYDNVLVPFGEWTLEEAVPAGFDVLSGALDVLDAGIEVLQPHGEWLWDEFISPLADWTGEIITTGLENLSDELHDLGDWIRENPDSATELSGWLEYVREDVEAFFDTTSFGAGWYAFWEDIGMCVFDTCGDMSDVLRSSSILSMTDFWEYFGGQVYDWTQDSEKMFDDMYANIGGLYAGFATQYYADVANDFTNALSDMEDFGGKVYDKVQGIKDHFRDGRDKIKTLFAGIDTWFRDRFNSARDYIKASFDSLPGWAEGVWNNITEKARNGANQLIDKINGLGNGLESGLNNIVNGLNQTFSFSIPEGVPGIGGTSFGLALPSVSIPDVPHFAKGAIVSQPTLAMVGDNPNAHSDPEVISPLSKLQDLLGEVQGGASEETVRKLTAIIDLLTKILARLQEIEPSIAIGDDVIYAASRRGQRRYQKMKGAL